MNQELHPPMGAAREVLAGDNVPEGLTLNAKMDCIHGVINLIGISTSENTKNGKKN